MDIYYLFINFYFFPFKKTNRLLRWLHFVNIPLSIANIQTIREVKSRKELDKMKQKKGKKRQTFSPLVLYYCIDSTSFHYRVHVCIHVCYTPCMHTRTHMMCFRRFRCSHRRISVQNRSELERGNPPPKNECHSMMWNVIRINNGQMMGTAV